MVAWLALVRAWWLAVALSLLVLPYDACASNAAAATSPPLQHPRLPNTGFPASTAVLLDDGAWLPLQSVRTHHSVLVWDEAHNRTTASRVLSSRVVSEGEGEGANYGRLVNITTLNPRCSMEETQGASAATGDWHCPSGVSSVLSSVMAAPGQRLYSPVDGWTAVARLVSGQWLLDVSGVWVLVTHVSAAVRTDVESRSLLPSLRCLSVLIHHNYFVRVSDWSLLVHNTDDEVEETLTRTRSRKRHYEPHEQKAEVENRKRVKEEYRVQEAELRASATGKGVEHVAGIYSFTSKFSQIGKFEANHAPPDSTYSQYWHVKHGMMVDVHTDNKCSHTMKYAHHRRISSTGSGVNSETGVNATHYQADLRTLIALGAGGMRKALEREIEDIKDKALDADYDTSGLKGLIECHRDTMFSITEDEAKALIDLL